MINIKNNYLIMLYHLSEQNLNGKTLYPRVPEFASWLEKPDWEDNYTPRVCFSTSIAGAYRALKTSAGGPAIMYVHVPDCDIKSENIKKCEESDVYDSIVTDEYWILQPVRLKCIAKIYITYRYEGHRKKYMHSDGNYDVRHHVHFRYIEKYVDNEADNDKIYEAVMAGIKKAFKIC